MNYTELKTAIKEYTENFQFTDPQLATFIQQTEQRIYNTVQLAYLRKNVTGALSTGATGKYLSAPSDYLSTYSLAVIDDSGEYHYLKNVDVNYIRQIYPSPTSTGLPKYYAIFGPTTTPGASPVITNELSFIVGPTPDQAYAVELHYFYYPISMTDTVNNPTGTTWLGDNFDSALLYGSLIEAYTFMKGEQDMMALYDTKYKEALMLLKNLGDAKQRGDAYVDGQVKLKVQ
jgi:hypothetical protein